jgi:Tol biopolymer transport system component
LNNLEHTAQIGLVSVVDGALRVLKSVDWRGASKLAFSPDGKYLAYDLSANADSEQREIHLMAIDGSRETTMAQPANDRVLGWSPDGRRLLFASDRSGLSGVWAQPVSDGKPQGAPELIKTNINPGSLGLTRSGALYYSVRASGRDIYLASVDFETGKLLSPPTILPQPYVGLNDFPQWSPDGKYLAYLSRRDANSRSAQMTALAIRSTETGQVRELRPNLAYIYSAHPRPLWSPDGRSLLVNGKDNKGRQGIFRIDAQSGEAAPLITSDRGQGDVSAVGWLPNGRMLYIRRDLQSKQDVLFVRDMQSGQEREIVRRDGVGGVAVSPDGRLLAVTGFDRSTKSGSLLLVPAEGGEPRELLRLSDSGPETLGAFVGWLPDGKSLLFRKGPRVARETFRIPAEGGAPVKYGEEWTLRASATNPADGRQVAFAMGEYQLEIWAMENFLPALASK